MAVTVRGRHGVASHGLGARRLSSVRDGAGGRNRDEAEKYGIGVGLGSGPVGP